MISELQDIDYTILDFLCGFNPCNDDQQYNPLSYCSDLKYTTEKERLDASCRLYNHGYIDFSKCENSTLARFVFINDEGRKFIEKYRKSLKDSPFDEFSSYYINGAAALTIDWLCEEYDLCELMTPLGESQRYGAPRGKNTQEWKHKHYIQSCDMRDARIQLDKRIEGGLLDRLCEEVTGKMSKLTPVEQRRFSFSLLAPFASFVCYHIPQNDTLHELYHHFCDFYYYGKDSYWQNPETIDGRVSFCIFARLLEKYVSAIIPVLLSCNIRLMDIQDECGIYLTDVVCLNQEVDGKFVLSIHHRNSIYEKLGLSPDELSSKPRPRKKELMCGFMYLAPDMELYNEHVKTPEDNCYYKLKYSHLWYIVNYFESELEYDGLVDNSFSVVWKEIFADPSVKQLLCYKCGGIKNTLKNIENEKPVLKNCLYNLHFIISLLGLLRDNGLIICSARKLNDTLFTDNKRTYMQRSNYEDFESGKSGFGNYNMFDNICQIIKKHKEAK